MVDQDLWVFGYGSLVWRPAFPFDARITADLPGFARRFWQGSTDHRGVPGAPGRVVTLIHDDASGPCRGLAYRVPAADQAAVLARLDHREKGGYDRLEVDVHTPDGHKLTALVYRANETNPCWLGPASVDAIAHQVVVSRGPSGPNDEYVLELDRALKALGAHDEHVQTVARAVRALRGA